MHNHTLWLRLSIISVFFYENNTRPNTIELFQTDNHNIFFGPKDTK